MEGRDSTKGNHPLPDFPNCGFFLKESHIGVVTRPLTVASVDAADVPQGRERDPKKRRV